MPKALVLGGATGLLGQALMRALAERGWDAESLGRQDGDVFDLDFLEEKIRNAAPDVVFNTIAYTQVDAAEEHEAEALEVNRVFPDGLARVLSGMGKGLLAHFSTDFVFDGPHAGPWRETDAPSPASVYGATKLAGENAVLSVLPNRACVLRAAWLFGPGRKNFVSTILRACAERESLNVVEDQIGSPTYTVDLAQWSVALAEKGATGIWHCVNSGQASWCELAGEAVNLSGCSCRIVPIPSSQWPQKARRPANSVLDNSKLAAFLGKKPRPWPNALRDYLFGGFHAAQEEKRP